MTQPGSIVPARPAWFPRTQRVGISECSYGWLVSNVDGVPSDAVNTTLTKAAFSGSGTVVRYVGGPTSATLTKAAASFAGLVYEGQPVIYSGSTANRGASVTIPAHAVGDLLIICAFRDNSATLPTKPAASGTVPVWADIDANTGANAVSMRTASFVATATDHTSGTWTNATDAIAVVVKNQNAVNPFGGHSESGGTRASGSIAPAVTLSNSDGRSLLLCFHGRAAGGDWTAWSAAPTGYTRRAGGGSTTNALLNTKDVTTSDGAATQASDGTTSLGYRGATIEILD